MARDRRTDQGTWDDEATDCFEKIRKQTKPLLPTAGDRRARRSSKETPGSRRIRKTISSQGGMHRRRQKKVH